MVIGGIVLGHNITAEDGDTLSEWVDGWLEKHPLLTRAVISVVALHLANALPPRYDLVHLAFVRARCLYPLRRKVANAIAPPK
jgi:hypothetical protein